MSTKLSRYEKLLQQPQVRSLLDTIRYAEGTPGEAGYRTQFTGVQFDPNKRGWAHPRQVKGSSSGYRSDAAGAYQFLSPTWDGVQKELGLSDFSPRNQDIAALRLIERRGALDPFLKGAKFGEIMNRLSPEWASLPTNQGKSYYGQPVKNLGDLYNYYEQRKQTNVLPVATAPASTPVATESPSSRGNALGSGLLRKIMGMIPAIQQRRSSLPEMFDPFLGEMGMPRTPVPADFLHLFMDKEVTG
jgi:muramidase (phage lysozyme)